jgi:3-methylfumaryl-CoA hydratase
VNELHAAITADELTRYRAHVGRSETRRQELDAESLRRYAVAVGASPDVEHEAPPLAHWAYFLECVVSAEIGTDGHPRRAAGILPPVRLPRRMFAASEMTFLEPLTLFRDAQMTLTVSAVERKAGKSGDLILVDVDRIIMQDDRARIKERQTLVYAAAQRTVAVVPLPEIQGDAHLWTPTTVELLRFSAVTFNAHRIHYDLPYAQTVEGYPALVVHGPLTAARLFAHAKTCYGAAAVPHRFRFRALAPLFVDQPVRLAAGGDGRVDAVRCDGMIAMSAQWTTGVPIQT